MDDCFSESCQRFQLLKSNRIRFRTSIIIFKSGNKRAPRTFTLASPLHRFGECTEYCNQCGRTRQF